MEMKENSILESLEKDIEIKSIMLLKKNMFILNLLNSIIGSFDINFPKLEKFDLEANIQDFNDLFDYLYSLCKNKPVKNIALRLISFLILQDNDLNQNYEKLLTDINAIVLNENYLDTPEKRKKIMNDLMNDLKLCLKKEKYKYVENYKKFFGMDLMTLFEMIIFLYSDKSNKDLLYFALKALTKKYKNLLIYDSVLNSKEIENPNYINCLNQLLELTFVKDLKTLDFQNSIFLIRAPNNTELENYYNGYYSKIIDDYFEGNLLDDNITKVNKNSLKQIPKSASLEEINIDTFTPEKKYIYSLYSKLNAQINELKQENLYLKFKVGIMDFDLKKIKIHSIYNGIIDIFASVYNIKTDDYYNKLTAILKELNKYPENNKVKELKGFLLDIYSCIKKGNCVAHTSKENITPLNFIFSELKKDQNKDYGNLKGVLEELSLNQTLSNAVNNYDSLKDKNKLLTSIQFDQNTLESFLIK